tara:strand:+ start:54 stop:494 length:441 start_codon:yes stop_codon:yes gene_type:complete
MQIDLLVASLVLVSCVFAGISGIIITRNKTALTPTARRRMAEQDAEIKTMYAESRKLKGTIARMKRGPELTPDDIKAGGHTVLDTLADGLPTNYKKVYKKYKHLVEPLVMDADGNLKPEIIDKLTGIISKSNAGPKEESQQFPQSL